MGCGGQSEDSRVQRYTDCRAHHARPCSRSVMLTDTLRGGFQLAHSRVGLVFLDLLWKCIWTVVTVIALLLVASWILSDISAISWENSQVGPVNGLVAAALLRRFLSANRAEILAAAALVAALSITVWFLLEALFRRKFVDVTLRPAAA